MKTEKSENKSNMFKVRMSDDDIKDLKRIAKSLKASDSETVRTLIKSKIQELNKQKNIFE
jgi:uncharacterized Ntn-hydrolase superfamily protein